MNHITLEVLQHRLMTVRRQLSDGRHGASRPAYIKVTGPDGKGQRRFYLTADNFEIDDDGTLVVKV